VQVGVVTPLWEQCTVCHAAVFDILCIVGVWVPTMYFPVRAALLKQAAEPLRERR